MWDFPCYKNIRFTVGIILNENTISGVLGTLGTAAIV